MSDKLKGVPENYQKRTARDAKLKAEADKLRATRRAEIKVLRESWIKKAQTYEQEYKQQIKRDVDAQRAAKATGSFYVPDQPKVYAVVRIRGTRKLHPDVIRILRLLRVRQIHNTTFVRVNKATTNMLRKVEPYITYGYPSVSTIRKLIYKRGFVRVEGRRVPLSDNRIVEQKLGKVGINCVEDLIHEVATCGPNFKAANNFIWPFKLNNPRGGYRNKRHPFMTKGDWGNREAEINTFINRMI